MNVSLNSEQGVFVLKQAGGYSCLGFEVVAERINELARRLAKKGLEFSAPSGLVKGSIAQFELYQALMKAWVASGADNEIWFDANTPEKLRRALISAYNKGTRVRIFYGNPETGEDYLEEHSVMGRVGHTTGPMKSLILVEEGDCGGGIINSGSVMRMVDLDTNKVLYQNARHVIPAMRLVMVMSAEPKGLKTPYPYVLEVKRNNTFQEYALFDCPMEGHALMGFLSGKTNTNR